MLAEESEMFKVYAADERNVVSESEKGAYFVIKKNILAQLSFGGSNTFKTAEEAFSAMQSYLASRKDSAALRVQINEFI